MRSNVFAGILFLAAAVLQLTRIIPIAMNMPEGVTTFPPEGVDQLALLHTEAATGIVLSHIMALASFPLFFIGILCLYSLLRDRGQQGPGLTTVVLLGLGFILFSMAVVIDGFVLQGVAQNYMNAPPESKPASALLVTMTHNTALSFMAPGMVALMLGLFFVSFAMKRAQFLSTTMAWMGMIIGGLSVLFYAAGVTGAYWDNMQVAGSLIMFHHAWYVWLGVSMVRGKYQEPAL